MWLDKLKDLKAYAKMTSKDIAAKANLPEDTVSRIFAGKTLDPRVDTIRRIVAVLDGSIDDIFAESGAVVVNATIARIKAEAEKNAAELELLTVEATALRNENSALRAENEVLRLKLEHKEEIIAIHNYYIRREESAKDRSGTKILR
jgi:transcriptional regulator with XRE-family HTH domain